MFHEKGVVLKSSISDNVKIVLALWEREGEGTVLLAKPTIRRLDKRGKFTTNQVWKAWHRPRELAALQSLIPRALEIMDKHEEGTLDLSDVLAEDEDARLFVGTETVMYPTIEGMFQLGDKYLRPEKQNPEPQEQNGVIEVDPNDKF